MTKSQAPAGEGAEGVASAGGAGADGSAAASAGAADVARVSASATAQAVDQVLLQTRSVESGCAPAGAVGGAGVGAHDAPGQRLNGFEGAGLGADGVAVQLVHAVAGAAGAEGATGPAGPLQLLDLLVPALLFPALLVPAPVHVLALPLHPLVVQTPCPQYVSLPHAWQGTAQSFQPKASLGTGPFLAFHFP